MKSTMQLMSPALVRVDYDIITQFNGTTAIPLPAPPGTAAIFVNIGTTSSLTYVPILTNVYTIDVFGKINCNDIFIDVITNNSANGTAKFQISGDGGATFIDVTNDMTGGATQERTGMGAWITNVVPGINMLQIRVMGKSTNGAVATISVQNSSFFFFVFLKQTT